MVSHSFVSSETLLGSLTVDINVGSIPCVESRAICRYIAMKYPNQGTKLLPDASDIKAVAIFEQAINIEQADFDPNASGITMQKLFLPYVAGLLSPISY